MLMTGNQAIALGGVMAGCKFYAAYPMTPATGILHWMAAHAVSARVVVKQAEDELAVINMGIGAAHAGVRAMVGTSGGGFSLMTEALGLAGMTETPDCHSGFSKSRTINWPSNKDRARRPQHDYRCLSRRFSKNRTWRL